jgi:hypothetical protein
VVELWPSYRTSGERAVHLTNLCCNDSRGQAVLIVPPRLKSTEFGRVLSASHPSCIRGRTEQKGHAYRVHVLNVNTSNAGAPLSLMPVQLDALAVV